MKILVTVKAYPGIGRTEGETVCVAGVRLDTEGPEWVRLWPVGFRELPTSRQFSKWQIIEVDATRTSRDRRPESFRPNLETLKLGETVSTDRGSWRRRSELLGPLLGETTLCALQRANANGGMAPSLGLVRVRPGATATIEPGAVWTPERELQAQLAAQPHLLRDQALTPLRPQKVQVRYHWHCMDADCRGHSQASCDWEVGASALKWERLYRDNLHEKLLETYEGKVLAPDRDTHFFVGNQHQHLGTFMVLGAYYPPLPRQA